MNPEFKYLVVSTNPDGDTSTARFLNAASAYRWAERVKNEGTQMSISQVIEGKEVTIALADLRKEAGPCLISSKKTGRSSRKR